MEAAAQQAGVLSQASREVSDTSQRAAESLPELRAAIGEISTSANRASAAAEEAVRDAQAVGARIAALQAASEAIPDLVELTVPLDDGTAWLVRELGRIGREPLDRLCDDLVAEMGTDLDDDVALLAVRLPCGERGAPAGQTPQR